MENLRLYVYTRDKGRVPKREHQFLLAVYVYCTVLYLHFFLYTVLYCTLHLGTSLHLL